MGGSGPTGGASPGAGGAGTGGADAPTGGRVTGGVAAGGSGPGTGGTNRDGGPASSGGSTGAGGGTGAKPTAGCGLATFPASGKYTIDVGGTQRSYIIKLPTGFDNTKPFRLVMTWHGLGGTAERTANAGYEGSYYGLEPLSNGQAIFTSGQGLSDSMGTGWANTNGQDVKFVKALVDYLRKTYCIDDSRIFSVGKSYGGLFSNTLGCAMGDVFRAIAPQSSWLETANPTCVGQTAVFIDHGDTDTTIALSRGEAARDLWLKNNHCGTTTKPWDSPETTCVAYDGCDADKPVIWCKFSGGHVMPSWASAAVWKFLMEF
jgi:poly(3-hydroxybutyrate) depolymerase